MHIISMSLGSTMPWSEDITAVMATRLTRKGHIVVAAMGNNGGKGFFSGGTPAVTTDGFGVGSIDSMVGIENLIKDDAKGRYGYLAGVRYGGPFPNITAPIVVNSPTEVPDDGCTELNVDPKHKVILFSIGTVCGSIVKCGRAQQAGAKGCLIYNAVSSPITISGDNVIPSGGISYEDGRAIIELVREKPNRNFFFSTSPASLPVSTGGTPSFFTSISLDAELHMKPDISGMGGFVYSTLPAVAGYYGIESGTSMACPYVAGSLALYIQAHGNKSASALKTVFQNNAKPVNGYKSKYPAHVAQQGAGLVNVYNTIKATNRVTPSSLSLSDAINTKKYYKLVIHNGQHEAVTYNLTNLPTLTAIDFVPGRDMMLNEPRYVTDFATVNFSRILVTVPAGGSKTITVRFTAPLRSSASLYPFYAGFLLFTPQNAGHDVTPLRVPYVGVKGNWKNASIFNIRDTRGNALGFLNPNGRHITGPTTYNFTDPRQQLNILLALATPAPFIKGELFSVNPHNTKSLGYLYINGSASPFSWTYLPQGSSTLDWSGKLSNTPNAGAKYFKVKPGKYYIRLSALRHFGNPTNSHDYQVVSSPQITVVY
eukprot:TRINITY_DN2471_c0_g1_i2.p1 TRINITY_DN2471_c0_g1~~TRINITY_DN2471_c0_g1_i2.p1  ORF type:complete len:649 (-),score=99.47 TRINITY_DN2471_c0_g1_i2:283-2073(-)